MRWLSVLWVVCLAGCGGLVEATEDTDWHADVTVVSEDAPPASKCELPPNINTVDSSYSGYVWTGVASPHAYQLNGTFLVSFSPHWQNKCTIESDGSPIEPAEIVLSDSLVTICGCPFEVSFTSVE